MRFQSEIGACSRAYQSIASVSAMLKAVVCRIELLNILSRIKS